MDNNDAEILDAIAGYCDECMRDVPFKACPKEECHLNIYSPYKKEDNG